MGSSDFALANLRHLYSLMLAGHVTDTAKAARGLLGPSIEALERSATTSASIERAAALAWNEALEAAIAAIEPHLCHGCWDDKERILALKRPT